MSVLLTHFVFSHPQRRKAPTMRPSSHHHSRTGRQARPIKSFRKNEDGGAAELNGHPGPAHAGNIETQSGGRQVFGAVVRSAETLTRRVDPLDAGGLIAGRHPPARTDSQ